MQEASARDNVLTEREIERVEDSLKNFREQFVFKGLLYTGLRVSAFIHLNRGWIRENKIFVPRREKCNCKACQGEWTPKTEASVRSVPVLAEVESTLRKLFSNFSGPKEIVGTRNNVNNILKNIERRVNIGNHLHPHGLRATFASLMAKKGLDVWNLQDLMGWASLKPARYYVKMYGPEQEKKVREAWGQD